MDNPKCEFTNCVHQANGYCHDIKHRKECLEMSMAILCLDGYQSCGFCSGLRYAKTKTEIQCDKYNKTDKIGHAKARVGVKYSTYISDSRKKIDEKLSKTYRIKYCPVCGRIIRL